MSDDLTSKGTRLLQELRPLFLPASAVPVILGCALAFHDTGTLDWTLCLLTLAGVLCIHAGANTANDYFDHASGNDAANRDYVRPFTGGSRMIQNGLLAPREVLGLSVSCFAAGAGIGAVLWLQTGIGVPILGLTGLAGGFFYSAPPVRLADRGLGEPVVALLFGVWPTLGAYYVQTGRLSGDALLLSLAPAVLILMVLLINEFPDAAADAAVGKRTWVVRLGQRRAARLYLVLLGLWPLPIIYSLCSGHLPAALALALAPGLAAFWLAPRVWLHYDRPRTLAPANALTITLYLGVALLMALALVMARLFPAP